MLAWYTLPIISYYHGRQNSVEQTAALMDALIRVVEIPTVGHAEALAWRSCGISDFEDALQVACAVAGFADFIITRNVEDFDHHHILHRRRLSLFRFDFSFAENQGRPRRDRPYSFQPKIINPPSPGKENSAKIFIDTYPRWGNE